MITEETYRNLLHDIEDYFIDDAADAKKHVKEAPEEPFSQGEASAYQEVLIWMRKPVDDDVSGYRSRTIALGKMLRENALGVKDACQKGERDLFKRGQLLSYYSMIKWLQQQAAMLGIPLDEIHLGDIAPDRDLL